MGSVNVQDFSGCVCLYFSARYFVCDYRVNYVKDVCVCVLCVCISWLATVIVIKESVKGWVVQNLIVMHSGSL